MKKLTRKGHVDTLPVFGTTVKSVIKTPLLEAMGIKLCKNLVLYQFI